MHKPTYILHAAKFANRLIRLLTVYFACKDVLNDLNGILPK